MCARVRMLKISLCSTVYKQSDLNRLVHYHKCGSVGRQCKNICAKTANIGTGFRMFKFLVIVAAVLVAATKFCDATCRFTDQLRPVKVDFAEIAKKRYNIVYSTVNDFSVNVDHAYIDMKKTGDNTYRAMNTIFMKNGTTMLRNYTVVYSDGIMHETFDNKDESGRNYVATSYILSKNDDDSIYFYRCSDRDYPEDLRFIIVPEGTTMSDDSLNQHLAVDKKFKFNSNLFKLPNKL